MQTRLVRCRRWAVEFFVLNRDVVPNLQNLGRDLCAPRTAGARPAYNKRGFYPADFTVVLEIGLHLKSAENGMLYDVPPQQQACKDIEKELLARTLRRRPDHDVRIVVPDLFLPLNFDVGILTLYSIPWVDLRIAHDGIPLWSIQYPPVGLF